MKAAYGARTEADSLARGLSVAAEALNRGDIGRAMVASLNLRLSPLNWGGAVRIAAIHETLAKFDPDEPRDWRGRWTTGDAGAALPHAAKPQRAPIATSPVGQRRRPAAPPDVRDATTSAQTTPTDNAAAPERRANPAPDTSWGGAVHLFGGRLLSVVDEDEPPGMDRVPPRGVTAAG